jgi:hypothetical protein
VRKEAAHGDRILRLVAAVGLSLGDRCRQEPRIAPPAVWKRVACLNETVITNLKKPVEELTKEGLKWNDRITLIFAACGVKYIMRNTSGGAG